MGDAFMLALRIMCQCASTMMILSPTPTVFHIYKTKDVGIASVVPLVAVLGNSYSWMLYGYMGSNIFPIFTNFMTGVVAASIFIATYYRYTPDRRRVLRVLGFEVVALSIVTTYFFLALYGVTHQSRDSATLVVGAMGVFFSTKLYGAGLERIKLVLKHKTGIYIPIHMVIMGTVNNFLWVVYTSLDDNWLMFGCCLTSCLLSVLQLVLYFVYHPNGQRAAAAKLGAADRGIEDENGIPITVVVRSTSSVDGGAKHAATVESPVFHALRSPLSPIHRHDHA